MRKITIPFNSDLMTVRDMKAVIDVMVYMLNGAYNMRNDHKNIPGDEYLKKCDDFFWKFKSLTKDISTHDIEEILKEEGDKDDAKYYNPHNAQSSKP